MADKGLVERMIEVLAEIQAVHSDELAEQIEREGMDSITLSSHEIVALLVALEETTGIDPSDRDVLKGCNVQSLQQFIEFVRTAGRAAK